MNSDVAAMVELFAGQHHPHTLRPGFLGCVFHHSGFIARKTAHSWGIMLPFRLLQLKQAQTLNVPPWHWGRR